MEEIIYDRPFLTYDEQIFRLIDKYNLQINNKQNAKLLLSTLSYYDLVNGYKECFMENEYYKGNLSIEDLASFLEFDRNFQSVLFKYSIYVENRFKTILAYHIGKNFGVDIDRYLDYSKYRNNSEEHNVQDILNNIKKIPEEEFVYQPTRHYREKRNHIPPWVLFKNISFNDAIDLLFCLKDEDFFEVSKNLFTYLNIIEDQIDINETSNIKRSRTYQITTKSLIIVRKFRNKIAHNLKFITYRTGKDELFLKSLSSSYGGCLIETKDFAVKRGRNDPYAMILSISALLDHPYFIQKFYEDLSRTILVLDSNSYNIDIFKHYCNITNIPENLNERFKRHLEKI